MKRARSIALSLAALACLGARSFNSGTGPAPKPAIMPSVIIDDSSGTRNVRVFGCLDSDVRVFAQVRRVLPDTTAWMPAYSDSTDTNWTQAAAFVSVDIALADLADSTSYVYEARALYSSAGGQIITPWIPSPITSIDGIAIRAMAGTCTTGGTVNIAGQGFGTTRRWARNDKQPARRLMYENFEEPAANDLGLKFGNSNLFANTAIVANDPASGLYSIRGNLYNGRADPITGEVGLAGNAYPFRPLWGDGARGDTLWIRFWLKYDQSDWTRGQETCCGKDQYFTGERGQQDVSDAYYNDRMYTDSNKFSQNHSAAVGESYVPTLAAWRTSSAGRMSYSGIGSAYFTLDDGDSVSLAPPYGHADGLWHRWDFLFDYASDLHTVEVWRDNAQLVSTGTSDSSNVAWRLTEKIPLHPQWLCVGARFPYLQTSNYPTTVDSIDAGFAGYQYDNYEVWVGRPGDSTVRLGNASTYRNCTLLVNQPVASWSGTGISIVFNAAGYEAGQTAWLYVTDDAGNTMINGAPVVVGYRLTKPDGEGSYIIGDRAME